MGTVVKLEQGSIAWLEHRKNMCNASETAVVMGASPFMTPYELWQLRTGRREHVVTDAMRRGTALEPAARSAYENLTGVILQPLVLVDGDFSASLDGMTFDRKLIVEIKCPVKGKDSVLWKNVAKGEIPVHYRWQIEHQLMVSGADRAHLYVFDGISGEGLILEAQPNPDSWGTIREAWEVFMCCIKLDTPPALIDKDKRQRRDDIWQAAAGAYLNAKSAVDEANVALKVAKEELLSLVEHPSESGGGVTVTRYWKQGAVDYKNIPQIMDVDLELYRKAGREEVRITVHG